MFDKISLWLCCQERNAPQAFEPPEGPPVTFTPLAQGEIKVEPWPFTVAYLELEIPGRRIAVAHYKAAAELAAATSQTIGLSWRLLPG